MKRVCVTRQGQSTKKQARSFGLDQDTGVQLVLGNEATITTGFGIAPSEMGKGLATQAVAALLHWGRQDGRAKVVLAETSVGNIASQKVLERNAFEPNGERHDEEDGPLKCWRYPLA